MFSLFPDTLKLFVIIHGMKHMYFSPLCTLGSARPLQTFIASSMKSGEGLEHLMHVHDIMWTLSGQRVGASEVKDRILWPISIVISPVLDKLHDCGKEPNNCSSHSPNLVRNHWEIAESKRYKDQWAGNDAATYHGLYLSL